MGEKLVQPHRPGPPKVAAAGAQALGTLVRPALLVEVLLLDVAQPAHLFDQTAELVFQPFLAGHLGLVMLVEKKIHVFTRRC